MNLDSGSNRPQQISNLVRQDLRSLLKTNSRGNTNIEMTIDTTRMISDEITNLVTKKLREFRASLNSQVQDAISIAITAKVLAFIQDAGER